MRSYFGYNKPYIYVLCPKENAELTERMLAPLEEKGVLFCIGGKAGKKELRRVEAAHAVMLFVTGKSIHDGDFHSVVNCAVQAGKNILTVYLEDVEPDGWARMQLDSSYALFRSKLSAEELERKLSEAEIFRNMAVTVQQKKFQKRRGIMLATIPILAAALLFGTVVYPLMLAPVKETPGGIPGLKGLTQAELDKITELHICGDQVYTDIGKVHSWYNGDIGSRGEIGVELENFETGEHSFTTVSRGSVTDLSDLKKLRNLEVLEISGQQITDITPVYSLTKLRKLGVECNPITSLEGIEALQGLEELFLSGTDITDLTPVEALPRLRNLLIDGTYVRELPNTETLERLYTLCASGTNVQMSYLGRHEWFEIDIKCMPYDIRDFSFARDVESFGRFDCDGATVSDFMPVLTGKSIDEFNFSGIKDLKSISQLDGLVITKRLDVCHSRSLTSIEGIEKYDGIECICLKDCLGLTDLTPLNNLKNVQVVELSTPMKPLAEAQISPDACFKVEYRDD